MQTSLEQTGNFTEPQAQVSKQASHEAKSQKIVLKKAGPLQKEKAVIEKNHINTSVVRELASNQII